MKRISYAAISGLVLIIIGLLAIFGWLFHIPQLITVLPNYINMVFNTAICFVLSGTILLTASYRSVHQNKICWILGTIICFISGLTLLEYTLSISLGIDQFVMKVWLLDQNPFPGRMAVNTAICFLVAGITFLLFPFSSILVISWIVQVNSGLILLMGISAVLGYLLKLEFLYSWYQYTRMAIHTSISMVILGSGITSIWAEHVHYYKLYKTLDEVRILLLISLILIGITIISGVAGYTLFANNIPVREQLYLIIAIVITSITIGIILLYWQVLPVIRQMVSVQREALETSTRLSAILDHASEGIVTINDKGIIESFNPAAETMFGYSAKEIVGNNISLLIPKEYMDKHQVGMSRYLETKNATFIGKQRIEVQGVRKNSELFPMELAVTEMEVGMKAKFVGIMHDISERKKAEEELSFKAYYDTLTGLINRNQFEQKIDLTIATALRNQQRFALFFIDLDHFKQINDSLGHDSGDQLLKTVGERLRNNIRKTDIAARLGGDEFVVVLNGCEKPELASIFAQKILNLVMEPFYINEHELFITASIGISFYPADGMDYPSLLKSSDLALYKAKERGRNNYQFCTDKINEEIQEKISLKNEVKKSINQQDFYLVYLPKLDLDNRITGFEVLLRWKNEKYGDISPAKIIPLVEEMGLINQLGQWIIVEACEQLSFWLKTKQATPIITLNISARQYFQSNFIENFLSILSEFNLSADYFQFEINESLIMQDPNYSLQIINLLKKYGIQIVIDNFGTGYSSLNYLSQFQVDSVKISREFIKNILENLKHRELIIAMIALAKNLKIKVIAEGIETKEQYELLLQLGCDEFQGYYLSYPLISEKVSQFIDTHQGTNQASKKEYMDKGIIISKQND